jgi:hypothetical protein
MRWTKFIVEIVSRRSQGRSAVKLEAKKSLSKSREQSTSKSKFEKGLTTGINCAHNKPLSALPKQLKDKQSFLG